MEEKSVEFGKIIGFQDIISPATTYQENHENPCRIGKEQTYLITTKIGHQTEDLTDKPLHLINKIEKIDPNTQN